MTAIDHSISNSEVIPIVRSDIFRGHETAQFAVGILAIDHELMPGRTTAELDAYYRLRGNVYGRQARIVDPDLINCVDGTERDADDARSVHIGGFENLDVGTARVVHAIRLILRGWPHSGPLPIEGFFPDVFDRDPAPPLSAEVSRFISRHEDEDIQESLKWPGFNVALAYAMTHGLERGYAVLEEPVLFDLQRSGVPLQDIARPRYIERYRSRNYPVAIDPHVVAESLGLTQSDLASMRVSEGTMGYYSVVARGAGKVALVAA
ncbi:MAG TPA: acyl-homoserine-lactone synthase [Candidatus Saccharimonadales bacterium]|nr:acyl-homoserine-lactone synthase [Candidatus Saccharimonadales bacterium]